MIEELKNYPSALFSSWSTFMDGDCCQLRVSWLLIMVDIHWEILKLYMHFRPLSISLLMFNYPIGISSWMCNKELIVNTSKAEILPQTSYHHRLAHGCISHNDDSLLVAEIANIALLLPCLFLLHTTSVGEFYSMQIFFNL